MTVHFYIHIESKKRGREGGGGRKIYI